MTKFFLSVYDYFSQRRGGLFVLLSLLVILLSCFAGRIRLKEDIARFLPATKENERIHNAWRYVASSNTIAVYCNFGEPENNPPSSSETSPASGAVGKPADDRDENVHAGTPSDEAIAAQTGAIDALAERLRSRMDPSYIKDIFYGVNPEEMLTVSTFIIENMPYFLDEDDYNRMDTLLTCEAIERQLLTNKNLLTSSAGMILRHHFLRDPLQLTSGLMRKLQSFKVSDRFRLYDDHLFNAEHQAVMFIDCTIPVSESAANTLFLDSLESFIAETEKEFAGITFERFGAAEIGLANSQQIRKDTMFSVTLAVIAVFALLAGSFRSGRKILLVFVPVLFGGLFALAALHLLSGDVSVIAVGISSIMFGIAINYPLHFMERYSHVPDARIVMKDLVQPLTIGNITTVGAFLSLIFIGSDAMRDLGLFASLLLIGTILFVLLFLPHLLASRGKAPAAAGSAAEDSSLLGRLVARPFEQNRRLVMAVILLTVFFGFFSGGSRFDTDMRKINYMTASREKAFGKMMDMLNSNQHVMYYVTEGRDTDAALEANERNMPTLQALVDEGGIYRIGGIGGFLPSRVRQAERIRRWDHFWSARRDRVLMDLRTESRKAGFREDAFRSFEDMICRKWEATGLSHFDPVRQSLAKNYLIEKEDKSLIVNILYADASKAQELEQRLNGAAGPWSLSVATDTGTAGSPSPSAAAKAGTAAGAGTVAADAEFDGIAGSPSPSAVAKTGTAAGAGAVVADAELDGIVGSPLPSAAAKAGTASEAESADAGPAGSPPSSVAFDAGSITRRMVASLSDNFNYVLFVCGLIVFAFLVFSLGRIELTLIAFAPLALSWIWILGIMNIFDIRFNIVNIILATFIFGQGDDYTIFMTEGLMSEYAGRRKLLASYKKSIALSALIMFAGMGMLIFAGHPALRSLAGVAIIGMLSVVTMSFLLPPLLFRLLTMKGERKRPRPVTLRNLFATLYAFLFFLIMSAVLTLVGWFLFTFGRATEEKKLRYHKLLQRIARFVIYRIPQVATTFRNLPGETFDKPGIIICNHQSHLDLMCLMMLTPRLMILTNDWAWRSPFYGRMIRYAGFYPVSNGIEQAVDHLRDAVNRGYSIAVFPEGTRSADCSIRRFHRGAFYLAEQLAIDLIPVMIHGAGHVLPKEELMLHKGRISIRVLPRITPGDERFRQGYSPRSLDVRHYYQDEYRKWRDALETPDYYADRVIKSYLYKGPSIERVVRRRLRANKNYAAAIAAMPLRGEVIIRNLGYGEYALLLALVRKDLRITAIEPDPDIRTLATSCACLPENLTFTEQPEPPAPNLV